MAKSDLDIVFDKLRRMIAVVNKCLILDKELNTTIDMAKFREHFTNEDILWFVQCWDTGLVKNYRGKFFTLEPKINPNQLKAGSEDTVTVYLLKDEHGEVHTIFNNGIPSWTKEF